MSRYTPVAVRFGKIWLEFDGLCMIGNRSRKVAPVIFGYAAITLGLGELGIQFECAIKVG